MRRRVCIMGIKKSRAQGGSIIIGCQHPRVCAEHLRTYISSNMPFHPFQVVSSHPFSVFLSFSLPHAINHVFFFPFAPIHPAARINKIRLLFLTANVSRRTKCDSKRKKEMVNGVLVEPGGITLRRLNHLSRDKRVWSRATSKKQRIEINDYWR